MGSTTLLPDAVQWSEGLLLSPQHLQQNDIYWHEQLRHRLACLTPHYWGVRKLTVDRGALVKGHVVITELECVLPEGLVVQFPGSHSDQTLETDVGALAKSGGRPVRVWAQVRERGTAAAKIDNADRRYNSLPGEMTPDENTGDGHIQVGRLQIHVTLHAGDAAQAAPAGRGACPLLEVARDAQGHLRITGYHPPMLQLEASAFQEEHSLQRRLAQLTQKLWTKAEELAGRRSDDQPETHHTDPQQGQHLAAARHIARALPPLEIAVNAPQAHPADLYRALAQAVGQLACIGSNPIPLKMKPYLHENCMPQFEAAFEYIEAKLALVNAEYECLKFADFLDPRTRDHGFARRLPPETAGELIIELKPCEGQDLAAAGKWLTQARIAPYEMMPEVKRRRLLGARATPLSAHEIRERKLPPQAVLFKLQNDPAMGAQDFFRPDVSLCIEGDAGLKMPETIILYRRKQPQHGALPKQVEAAEPVDA